MTIVGKELQKFMIDNDIKQTDIVNLLGLSRVAVYRKFEGINQFTLEEVQKMAKAYNMTDDQIMTIFFANKVS